MKKILFLVIVLVLGIFAYNQYKQLQRFSPPSAYDYTAKTEDIDVQYYDPQVIARYFELCYEVGRFARQAWYNHRIDVRFPDESNPQSLQAALHYQQLLVNLQQLEARLIEAKKLKQKGFDNQAIRYIEEQGIAPDMYPAHRLLKGKQLQRGDKGEAVWYLQQLISQKHAPIRVDGIFNDETEQAIKEIQRKLNRYPSGVVDIDLFVQIHQMPLP